MKVDIWDTLALLGMFVVVAGVGLISPTAAVVLAGVALIAVGIIGARANGRNPGDRVRDEPGEDTET